jgi:peptide-methionine (S)-S-oxide reductase
MFFPGIRKMTSRSTLFRTLPSLALLAALVWVGFRIVASNAETATVVPAPVLDPPQSASSETIVLAGGCFWGVQGVFQHVDGVTSAVSGYAGGEKSTAEYEVVSSGRTGHAESVRVTFDPHKVSLGQILQVYFSVAHNPTELNRQGPDVGTQYRSTIFPTTAEQARVAKSYIEQLDQAHVFNRKVVTTIEAGRTFYPAERYHQDYLTLHPTQPYIAYNDLPKIENLKRLFSGLYRTQPILVAQSGLGN